MSPDEGGAVAAISTSRWSLPRGRVIVRALRKHPSQEYLLHLPASNVANAPVLVTVHGISRNAIEQARAFSLLSRTRGAVLVAPVFTAAMHADYQRLGRTGRGMRADWLLQNILDEVAALTGADVSQHFLLGVSGGAQFAHRYAMAHPHRVQRAAIVAAGWYTFPDPAQRFPYGIRAVRTLPGVNFDPEQFLRVPMNVFVGRKDTGSANVRRTERVDAQQGTNRVERARRWVAAMREASRSFGLDARVTLTEVAGADHSFNALVSRGNLIERVDSMLIESQQAATGLAADNVFGLHRRT